MTTQNLTKLYHRAITSNARLKQLKGMHAPQIIIRNERRVLREALGELAAGDDAGFELGVVAAGPEPAPVTASVLQSS
ncbi:MAG: hypothetical protein ACR2OM_13340 [Aestuariivirgaceae bacterium]